MKINVIGVPLNLGCDREGVERAPNHLRERGLMRIIRKNGHRAFDLGNLYVPLVSEADKFARGRSLKYLDAIVEVNNNLAELVYDTLRGGAFPLVIGGDHSLGLGSASGVGKSFDDFGIIWLDAHGDINTSETSPSGNIHGMPLSALMGMGSEELVNIYAPGNKVNPQNVFLVRTRSLDEGEQALIERDLAAMMALTLLTGCGGGKVTEHAIEKACGDYLRGQMGKPDMKVTYDVSPAVFEKIDADFRKNKASWFNGSTGYLPGVARPRP